MNRLIALRRPLDGVVGSGAVQAGTGVESRPTVTAPPENVVGAVDSPMSPVGWVPDTAIFTVDIHSADGSAPVAPISAGRHRFEDDSDPVTQRRTAVLPPAGPAELGPTRQGDLRVLGGWVPGRTAPPTQMMPTQQPGVPRDQAVEGEDAPLEWADWADDEWVESDFGRGHPTNTGDDPDDTVGDDSDPDLDNPEHDGLGDDDPEGGNCLEAENLAENREVPVGRSKRVGARKVGRHWGRFAELWVPESLRDARVDPGRRGAIILLLVAALAAVVTAAGVWRDRPEPRAVETAAVAALAGAPVKSGTNSVAESPTDAAGTAVTAVSVGLAATDESAPGAAVPTTNPTEIVVSVTGLVGQPGLVTLPAGARVADAIAAAGGVSGAADLTGVNLAARLADGDSVVVGSAPAAGDSASGGAVSGVTGAGGNATGAAAPSGLVNLNTADEAALDTLPGVGPVMAQNILAWRETNGKFTSIEQLQEIGGIGPSRYAQLSPLVTVS